MRSGSLWSQQAEVRASDAWPGDAFGGAVCLDGDTAIVGAGQGATPASGSCAVLVGPLLSAPVVLSLDGAGAGSGSAKLAGVVPPAAAGLFFALQAAISDPIAPAAFSTSNAVAVQVAR